VKPNYITNFSLHSTKLDPAVKSLSPYNNPIKPCCAQQNEKPVNEKPLPDLTIYTHPRKVNRSELGAAAATKKDALEKAMQASRPTTM
jgi:hypothetical protein